MRRLSSSPSPVLRPHIHNIILPLTSSFLSQVLPIDVTVAPLKPASLFVSLCVFVFCAFVCCCSCYGSHSNTQSGEQLLPIASPASSSSRLACFVAPAPAPVSYSIRPKEEQTQSSFFVQCVSERTLTRISVRLARLGLGTRAMQTGVA